MASLFLVLIVDYRIWLAVQRLVVLAGCWVWQAQQAAILYRRAVAAAPP